MALQTKATWAGIPCISFRYTNQPGFEPGYAEVVVSSSHVLRLARQQTRVIKGASFDVTSASGEYISGYLEIEVIDGPWRDYIHIGPLVVAPNGAEVIKNDIEAGQDTPMRLVLMDARGFWHDRGTAIRAFNVEENASGVLDVDTLVKSYDKTYPWTLGRIIETVVPLLPGEPVFMQGNDKWVPELSDVKPRNVIFDGDNLASMLQDLLDRYGLELHFNCVWGSPGKRPVVFVTYKDPARLSKADRLPESLTIDNTNDIPSPPLFNHPVISANTYRVSRRVYPNNTPDLMIVVGDEITYEMRVPNLIPVGVHKDTKRIVSLEDAAKSYGATMEELGRFVLMTPKDAEVAFEWAAAYGDEIRKWAFKWFSLPDWAWRLLPMEPLRVGGYNEFRRSQGLQLLDPDERDAWGPTVEAARFSVARLELDEDTDLDKVQEQLDETNKFYNLITSNIEKRLGDHVRRLAKTDDANEKKKIIESMRKIIDEAHDVRQRAQLRIHRILLSHGHLVPIDDIKLPVVDLQNDPGPGKK